ncbi:hypothetical protein AVEN_84258-1 [Araneus ventricosus]|uniref:Transposase Tc1-like domain-containing protein n=1 Tax=Araneus ventricosus TaxID=182803 RepID=A0A4Y2J291_ARAVE|nr:hypothetical protein AVEN_84258-1 [Araneus ventricosus]
MLEFVRSDSSAESEMAKAESLSRRNHLHDEMRWRAIGMLQAGSRQSAVRQSGELNLHRSVIHRLWNHYQRNQNASRRRGAGRRRIITTVEDRYLLQCARLRRTQRDSWHRISVLLQEGSYPAKLYHANCMKEDCSHDDLLFVCLCHQRTLQRGCIGPVNIAVRHQNSGATCALRMSLYLTPRTIPEGQ